MAEWLFEAGIGESRAALIEDESIIEALIEIEGSGLEPGSIIEARQLDILIPGKRITARDLESGEEILIENPPPKLDPTQPFPLEILRPAIHDGASAKRATGRVLSPGAILRPAPDLQARLAAMSHAVTMVAPFGPDPLAEAGWEEVLTEAETGEVPFSGGKLIITPTPALTLIDVDGWLDPKELCPKAAHAAGSAIRRLGITGSIAIDFPTIAERKIRADIAEAVLARIPPPVDHAGVNQFGLMHLVRPRARLSLIDHVRRDPAQHAARQLIRKTQRSGHVGAATLVSHPRVITALEARPDWLDALGRHLGGVIGLRGDADLGMSGGYVSTS